MPPRQPNGLAKLTLVRNNETPTNCYQRGQSSQMAYVVPLQSIARSTCGQQIRWQVSAFFPQRN